MDHIEIQQADLGRGGDLAKHSAEMTLDEVKKIAYDMHQKPNIIIKSGPNALWYIKKCPPEKILEKIAVWRQKEGRKCRHLRTMYVLLRND
jgi:hypothetical protein